MVLDVTNPDPGTQPVAKPSRRTVGRWIDLGTGQVGPNGYIYEGEEDAPRHRGRPLHVYEGDEKDPKSSQSDTPARSTLAQVAEKLPVEAVAVIKDPARLSRAEELDCIQRAQDGDAQARQRIIEDQRPYVQRLGQMYGRDELHDDLESVGLIAVDHAIDEYRPEKQTRLSTFATSHIKRAMFEVLAHHTIPSSDRSREYAYRKRGALRRGEETVWQQNGAESCTAEELLAAAQADDRLAHVTLSDIRDLRTGALDRPRRYEFQHDTDDGGHEDDHERRRDPLRTTLMIPTTWHGELLSSEYDPHDEEWPFAQPIFVPFSLPTEPRASAEEYQRYSVEQQEQGRGTVAPSRPPVLCFRTGMALGFVDWLDRTHTADRRREAANLMQVEPQVRVQRLRALDEDSRVALIQAMTETQREQFYGELAADSQAWGQLAYHCPDVLLAHEVQPWKLLSHPHPIVIAGLRRDAGQRIPPAFGAQLPPEDYLNMHAEPGTAKLLTRVWHRRESGLPIADVATDLGISVVQALIAHQEAVRLLSHPSRMAYRLVELALSPRESDCNVFYVASRFRDQRLREGGKGNLAAIARSMGVSRSTISRRLKRWREIEAMTEWEFAAYMHAASHNRSRGHCVPLS